MFKFLADYLKKLLIALSLISATLSHAALNGENFCWLDSYGRGVGTIPTSCGPKEYDAGLCYEKCSPGYNGVGPVCWGACPPGYIDMGAICHIDKPLVEHVGLYCGHRLFGLCIWWSSNPCTAGYSGSWGGLCHLDKVDLPNGLHGSWLDPMKSSYGRGVGTIPNDCQGKEYDAGLCYSKCSPGHKGVGPVCWGQCPSGKSACGAGCADSSSTCAQVTSNQVLSVTSLMVTIASSGLLEPLMKTATEAEQSAQLSRASQAFNQLKEKVAAARNSIPGRVAIQANNGRIVYQVARSKDLEDAMRTAANLDPTGVVATAASFSFPRCNAGW